MAANETHGRLEDILATANPRLRPICASLRKLILTLHPEAVEIVWPKQSTVSFGVGPKKMTEHYAYIAIQTTHVNLGFYQGAHLADPEHLLEGEGRNLRHIKLREPPDATSNALRCLVDAAIAERRAALRAV